MLGSIPQIFATTTAGETSVEMELKHPEKGEGHGILSRRSLAIAGSSKLEQGRFILLHSELCSLVARLCYQIPLRHLPGVRPSLPSALPSFLLQPHFASLTLFQ